MYLKIQIYFHMIMISQSPKLYFQQLFIQNLLDCKFLSQQINPFLANVPFLYLLETPENLWFCVVFREYKMGTLTRNGLMTWNARTKKVQAITVGQGECRDIPSSTFVTLDIQNMTSKRNCVAFLSVMIFKSQEKGFTLLFQLFLDNFFS